MSYVAFGAVLVCGLSLKEDLQWSTTTKGAVYCFHYTDLNGRVNSNLKLKEILEIVFSFVMEIPATTSISLTGKSSATMTDWYNMCREVCTNALRSRPQMIGTADDPI